MADLTPGTFVWHIGEDRAVTFTYSGGTVSTSGWTTSLTLTPLDESTTAITKTSGAGQITNDNSGIFVVTLARADSVNRNPTVFRYVFRRTDSGLNTVLGQGVATLLA